MATVEKKSKAKARHKRAAEAYQKWLIENPKTGKQRRMKMFDAFVDSAFLDERINGSG